MGKSGVKSLKMKVAFHAASASFSKDCNIRGKLLALGKSATNHILKSTQKMIQ